MGRIRKLTIDVEYLAPGDVDADVTYEGMLGETHTERVTGATVGEILGRTTEAVPRIERFLDES